MSTSRIQAVFLTTVLAGGLFVIARSWEGFDGRSAEYTDPRVLAEGPAGDAQWTVVLVHERKGGDCLHLRQQGALVERSCSESSVLDDYRVGVRVLRGTTEPLIFGVLPEGTARAELALTGQTLRRDPKRPTAPVQVRTFGKSGRYVVELAPTDRAAADVTWEDGSSAPIDLYDAGGARLTP